MISNILKTIFKVFIIVVLICTVVGIGVVVGYYKINLAAILLSIMGFGIIFLLFMVIKDKVNKKYLLALIIILGAILRIIYVVFANQPPVSDFKTYHDIAQALANFTFEGSRYVEIFPHVMGLPMFLAPFYKVFGAYPIVAQLLNVVVDILTIILIYKVCSKIFNQNIGIIGAFLFSIAPSVILYCEIICTEKLYTMLVLLFIYIVLNMQNRPVLFGIFAGFVAGVTNAVRPTGPMLLAAVIIFGLVIWKNYKKYISLVLIIAIYFVTVFANIMVVSSLSKNEVATKPGGWNLYVGFNVDSFGTWNEHDAVLFNEKFADTTISPNELHSQFKDLAVERIKSNGVFKNVYLMISKFTVIWATDISVFSYLHEEPIFLYMLKVFPLEAVSTAFYLWMVIFAAIGTFKACKKKEDNILLVMLIILGGAAMYQLAEVMGRYGYPSIVLFTILSAYGLGELNIIQKLKGKVS